MVRQMKNFKQYNMIPPTIKHKRVPVSALAVTFSFLGDDARFFLQKYMHTPKIRMQSTTVNAIAIVKLFALLAEASFSRSHLLYSPEKIKYFQNKIIYI